MYSNNTDIPLPYAVWLAADHGYDLRFNPNVVSATEILKPMRSIILSREIAAAKSAELTDEELVTRDIGEKAAAALGTAVHTAVELAWRKHYQLALTNLGYPESMIAKIVINPVVPDSKNINIYFEIRTAKQIEGFTFSGKFDLCLEGQIRDMKTTKVYTYINGSNNEKYAQQGSIYRWLNPEIVTNDRMIIDYYFTDWNPNPRISEEEKKKYPHNRMLAKPLDLMSLDTTEHFIRGKLLEIKLLTGKPQEELPRCTPTELWQNPAKWEYWSKAENKQCSKLLDSPTEAQAWLAEKGVGFIKERQFEPTFCNYCDAKLVCTQARGFIAEGLLTT